MSRLQQLFGTKITIYDTVPEYFIYTKRWHAEQVLKDKKGANRKIRFWHLWNNDF